MLAGTERQGPAFEPCQRRRRAGNFVGIDRHRPHFTRLHRAAARWLGIATLVAAGTVRADVYVADPPSRTIYRLAGDHVEATFSDRTGHPFTLALDAAGTLYGGDPAQGIVFKYSADGRPTPLATKLSHPFGLAFDHAGNLFVATVDGRSGRGSIVKLTTAGEQSVFAGDFKRLRGLAFDPAGNLYVSDLDDGRVYKLAPDGTRSVFASGIDNPTGLAFDPAGNLFVCSPGDGVLKITPVGVMTTFTRNVTNPRWLAFDAAGKLYVSDVGDAAATRGHGWVYVFTPAGDREFYAVNLAFPTGIAVSATPAHESGLEAISGIDVQGGPTLDLGDAMGALLMDDYAAKGGLPGKVEPKRGQPDRRIPATPPPK